MPENETESFTLDYTFAEGIVAYVEVTYPKGQALAGVQALSNAADPGTLTQILASLADDPSVARRLDEMGLELYDPGEEDDDDDYL